MIVLTSTLEWRPPEDEPPVRETDHNGGCSGHLIACYHDLGGTICLTWVLYRHRKRRWHGLLLDTELRVPDLWAEVRAPGVLLTQTAGRA